MNPIPTYGKFRRHRAPIGQVENLQQAEVDAGMVEDGPAMNLNIFGGSQLRTFEFIGHENQLRR